jgi:hypothetical protein
MRTLSGRSAAATLVALLVLSALGVARAQMKPASAQVASMTGKVEILQKGRSNWIPANVGALLVEGDQIRADNGGSAELNLPDGSSMLVAENTRFAVTKLDFDPNGNRDREMSFHVVAGKVRAQVRQAGTTLAGQRQSNFTISTPNGVAAIRGTVLVMAHNPATGETLAFVFPSPGQSPDAARVTFATRTGSSVIVPGGNFVRSVAGQPVGQPIPVSTLPATVQASLVGAQNQSTRGSGDLTNSNVNIPSHSDTLNTLGNAGAGGTGGTGGAAPNTGGGANTGNTGACTGCGQDVNNNQGLIKPKTCATPPCP